MISLGEYKEVLVNRCRYACDDNDIKRKERREYLDKHYSDEYLNKIINDSYNVIRTIFDISEKGYCLIELEDSKINGISLNLTFGWISDRLYIDNCGNIISSYILRRVFGEGLSISDKEKIYDDYSDDDDLDFDIVSFYYRFYLYLQNFPEDMQSIKEELFGVSKVIR